MLDSFPSHGSWCGYPICQRSRIKRPAFYFDVQSYMHHVVFKLVLAIILLLTAVSIAQDRTLRTYNGEDEMTKKTKNASPL
ncbi:protein of unknown function [Limnospira indica PCC 8005]|uniref:Uncharacterized protein n=1 Tax=Limnospira indica PCC 8005 TaxID=376219 RepID=A0A9P1KDR7_9CYAN|nr:protein of unknown function [Limnospira indica PCC 8005]